jgi:hypothetical protein
MTKFEKRNEYYATMQNRLGHTDEIRYIDGVLCINNIPVTDELLIQSQEWLFDYIDNLQTESN